MKKLLSLLLAVMLLCSLTITAFADSTIDLTRTGSIELWKYDLSSAQADGVWDSSYVSTGVRDQSGVEAILGASGSSSGYAIEGVIYSYLKVADLKSVTVTDNNVERSELMYGIVNNAANTAFLTAIGVSSQSSKNHRMPSFLYFSANSATLSYSVPLRFARMSMQPPSSSPSSKRSCPPPRAPTPSASPSTRPSSARRPARRRPSSSA